MAADDLEQQGSIGHRGRERPDLVKTGGEGHQPIARHKPVGGLDPDHPAQGGRLPDRTPGVAAQGQRGKPGSHRGG